MEAKAADRVGTQTPRIFEQDGERFTLAFIVASNAEDPNVADYVADLDTLAVGEELCFGIGGGWGNPIRRVQ